jgi:hypothetical protein
MVIAVLNNARAVPEISIETFTKNWKSFYGQTQISSRISRACGMTGSLLRR